MNRSEAKMGNKYASKEYRLKKLKMRRKEILQKLIALVNELADAL